MEAVVLSDSYRAVIDIHSYQVWSLSVQRKTNIFQTAEKTLRRLKKENEQNLIGTWNKTKRLSIEKQ
jgi:hypothetical protein